jgi:hypothetical protein
MDILIGKVVISVDLEQSGAAIRFNLADGESITARADGDCCSSTWIENVDGAEQLIGTVLSVEDIPMPDLGSPNSYDVIAYYGCKITTDKGFSVIDYRNSSNGFYGGSLSWSDDGFYGGVHGQNGNISGWKQIA